MVRRPPIHHRKQPIKPSASSVSSSSSTSLISSHDHHPHHHHHHHYHHHKSFTPAERLTRADDLMSDILDCFLWPTIHNSFTPSKRTIKFTSDYRRPRGLNLNDFKQIIHSAQTGRLRNLTEATTLIRQLPAVISYMSNAEPPRLGKHIGLYVQLFLPKCGIRFLETDRYNQRRQSPKLDQSTSTDPLKPSDKNPNNHSHQSATSLPSTQKSKRKRSSIRANELRDLLTTSDPSNYGSPSLSVSPSCSRLSSTRSGELYSPSNNLTHLAVFATRDYSPSDIVVGCEGSFADLTEEEDLKLRFNAHLPLHSPSTHSHPQTSPRQSTDFSHIVNSRGKFQVFCGPARFVNHDCNNNVELLREGFTIKFKVTKPIKAGEEILTSYGMNYFGEKNCECMCATCERNGMGFYSPNHSIINVHGQGLVNDRSDTITTTTATTAITPTTTSTVTAKPPIKREVEEASVVPSLSTDTDLSSLIDSSDGTTSRASNTPVLDRSPNVSYSNTPSQVRRQLALASHPHTLLPDPCAHSPNSRSSSARRQKRIRSPLDPPNSKKSTPFVSPIKFLPTNDLTQPIYNQATQPPSSSSNVTEFETLITPQPVLDSSGPELDIQSLPIKRKTYWITTKQKQLGLVPWESTEPTTTTSATPPPPSSSLPLAQLPSLSTSHQPYSPITPSLLGPRRRDSVERSLYTNRKSSTPSSTSTITTTSIIKTDPSLNSAKLPMRSYWVSTKEKQLGIVPWETNPKIEPSSGSNPTTTTPVPVPTTRSTRASRRASEGMTSIVGFPTAPRGSKLSYRVFQEGTEEAKLLNTAIGRELLGFRPKVNKKKLDKTGYQEGHHQVGTDVNESSIDTNTKDDPPQPTSNSVEPQQPIDCQLTGRYDSMIIEPLEEISSFLLSHPYDPQASTTTAPTTRTTPLMGAEASQVNAVGMTNAGRSQSIEGLRMAHGVEDHHDRGSTHLDGVTQPDQVDKNRLETLDIQDFKDEAINLVVKNRVITPVSVAASLSSSSSPSDSTSLITSTLGSVATSISTSTSVVLSSNGGEKKVVGDGKEKDEEKDQILREQSKKTTRLIPRLNRKSQRKSKMDDRTTDEKQGRVEIQKQEEGKGKDDGVADDDSRRHRKRLRSTTLKVPMTRSNRTTEAPSNLKISSDSYLSSSTTTTKTRRNLNRLELMDPNHHLHPVPSSIDPFINLHLNRHHPTQTSNTALVNDRHHNASSSDGNDNMSSSHNTNDNDNNKQESNSATNHPLWLVSSFG